MVNEYIYFSLMYNEDEDSSLDNMILRSLREVYKGLPSHLKPYMSKLYPSFGDFTGDFASYEVCQEMQRYESNGLKVLRFWFGTAKIVNAALFAGQAMFLIGRATGDNNWKTLYFDPKTDKCLGINKEEVVNQLLTLATNAFERGKSIKRQNGYATDEAKNEFKNALDYYDLAEKNSSLSFSQQKSAVRNESPELQGGGTTRNNNYNKKEEKDYFKWYNDYNYEPEPIKPIDPTYTLGLGELDRGLNIKKSLPSQAKYYFKNALNYFEETRKNYPNDEYKYYCLVHEASALINLEVYDEAESRCEQVLNCNLYQSKELKETINEAKRLISWIRDNRVDLLIEKSETRVRKKEYKLAETNYSWALRTFCKKPQYKSKSYKIAWKLAELLKMTMKYKQCLAAYDQAIELVSDPEEKEKIINAKNQSKELIDQIQKNTSDREYIYMACNTNFHNQKRSNKLKELYEILPDHLQQVMTNLFGIDDHNMDSFKYQHILIKYVTSKSIQQLAEMRISYGNEQFRRIESKYLYFDKSNGKYLSTNKQEAEELVEESRRRTGGIGNRTTTELIFNTHIWIDILNNKGIIFLASLFTLFLVINYAMSVVLKKLSSLRLLLISKTSLILNYISNSILRLFSSIASLLYYYLSTILLYGIYIAIMLGLGYIICRVLTDPGLRQILKRFTTSGLAQAKLIILEVIKQLGNIVKIGVKLLVESIVNTTWSLWSHISSWVSNGREQKRLENEWQASWSLIGQEEEERVLRDLKESVKEAIKRTTRDNHHQTTFHVKLLELIELRMSGYDDFNEGVRLQDEANRLVEKAKHDHNMRLLKCALEKFEAAKRKFEIGKQRDGKFQLCIDIVNESIEEINKIMEKQLNEMLNGIQLRSISHFGQREFDELVQRKVVLQL